MNIIMQQLKENSETYAKVKEVEFIENNKITSDTVALSIRLDKSYFKTLEDVYAYAKRVFLIDFPTVTELEEAFEISLITLDNVKDVRTVAVGAGVQFTIGEIFWDLEEASLSENEKEIHLSKIMLSEGQEAKVPNLIEVARVTKGYHSTFGEIEITSKDLESMVKNFNEKVIGVDLSIDVDHKREEAYGWVKSLLLSEDKNSLYAVVAWNDKGTKALADREYRYFSPTYTKNYKHPHSGKTYGVTLLGGALTNTPFLKMDAIVNFSDKESQENVMETISLAEHNEQLKEVQDKLVESEAKAVELSEKVKSLEEKIAHDETMARNQKLFDDGKISKAQLVALNEGKDIYEVLSLSDKELKTTEIGAAAAPQEKFELSETEKSVCAEFGLAEKDFIEGV